MSEQVLSINGRTLAYRIFGDPDGSLPLIWFHGTPAGCTPPPSLVAAAKTSGVRIIAPERPGYGDSARRPGRKIIDMVGDVEALKTHLGVDKCLIAGWSGGGPHALACGARLPGVLAVLTIAGVGPADAKDLDFLAGQGEDNVVEFRAAMKGEDALREFCTAQRKDIVSGSVAHAVAALSSILSGVDLEASKGDLGVYLVELLREGLRNGIEGWVDDDLEFVLPWGFELSEIKVPVLLYQGSDDKMVPYAHGKWLADHLPKEHLRAHLIEGEGHVSLVAKGEALLSELIEAAKAASG